MTSQFFAHSNNQDQSQWQLIITHLINTAELARDMGAASNCAEFAYLAALLHDIGKYSYAFQRRISGDKKKVDHSTAGAQEIIRIFPENPQQQYIAKLLSTCIAGHHGGLPNYGSEFDLEVDNSLCGRLKRQVEPYDHYTQEIAISKNQLPISLPLKPDKKNPGFSISFFTRMVYSALVDADFQETETFMNGGKKPRGQYESLANLCGEYNTFLSRFENSDNKINRKRTESLNSVVKKASEKPGFFTLTIPTGGGKTFTSMAFALNHAIFNGLNRIIYVIPYTSIIEQNAAVFKECLGEENILEHHSNFDWENFEKSVETNTYDDLTRNVGLKMKLASENWDIPIIVTTNVQFFESLFSNRSSRCRKIHNLAKSVIIFDEAQMLPREYMQPCMLAVKELVINYGASVIFCTATQPALKRFFSSDIEFHELADAPQALFDFYKRVTLTNIGKITDLDLIHRINSHDRVLCIVNTRKHAKGLFGSVLSDGRFHLSTLMYPNHRIKTIEAIHECLAKNQTCRVISTQVLEAGVDMDFPVGYRAFSGLDSIIQAAGRINREGKQPNADLFVFETDSEFVKRMPGFIKQGAEVARSILRNYSNDPICVNAIKAYYNLLYDLQDKDAFDQKKILGYLDTNNPTEPTFEYSTVSEKFKIIDENTRPVIVQLEEKAKLLVNDLKHTQYPKTLARKLQRYTVNIFEYEFNALQEKGLIDTYCDYFYVLNNNDYYDLETGLQIPERSGGDVIWFDG